MTHQLKESGETVQNLHKCRLCGHVLLNDRIAFHTVSRGIVAGLCCLEFLNSMSERKS